MTPSRLTAFACPVGVVEGAAVGPNVDHLNAYAGSRGPLQPEQICSSAPWTTPNGLAAKVMALDDAEAICERASERVQGYVASSAYLDLRRDETTIAAALTDVRVRGGAAPCRAQCKIAGRLF